MKLAAERVKELQYFLMAAARSGASAPAASMPPGTALLARAAALDYVLLLCSERPEELLDPGGAGCASAREAIVRAVHATLDVVVAMLERPNDAFADFVDRHVRADHLFDTLRAVCKSDVVVADDVAFRILTTASDLFDRLSSGDSPRRGSP